MTDKPLLLFLLLMGFSATAQMSPRQDAPDPDFHIYLLMGQSNMAGRGEVAGPFAKRSHRRVWMLDKQGAWQLARHPLHFDKPRMAGVGPGLAFGIRMAQSKRNVRIGLVPCAVGGTSIDRWNPGAFDKATGTHPYDDALGRIRMAMKSGVIKGIIWHQGESDSKPEAAEDWLKKLEALIGRLREETKNDSLPFVAGQLGRYRENYQLINRQLDWLPGTVPRTAVVSSKGLKHKGDGTHFDSPSARRLGKRFAKAMRRLQQTP